MSSIKQTFIYKYLAYRVHKYKVERNPEDEINRYFRLIFGRNANLNTPRNLIEKIYWMQLHTDTSAWTLCSDKYRMREYVERKGLGNYLPKLYGKWESPEDIDFSLLPRAFVMKANNGCATVKIIKDKDRINPNKAKQEMKRWLAIPFGYSGFEPHYLNIKPCIIAEELLIQSDEEKLFSPYSIIDYKVWCINGKPESIFVGYNRKEGNLSMSLYDKEWKSLAKHLISSKRDTYHPEVTIPKPCCLEQMLEMASILSSDFPECRVDFYVINNKPIIGELTFSSGYGYFTEDYYNYLGDKIDLTKLKKIK